MRIKNNPKIFYLACGLLANGYTQYDHDDAEIVALAKKIQEAAQQATLDAEIMQWFDSEAAGQAMQMAAVYTEDAKTSNLNDIVASMESIFRGFWKEYCGIMFARTNGWMPEIEAARRPLREFFGRDNIPNMVLSANLFASPGSTDFVNISDGGADTTIHIACKPDMEGILRGVLRTTLTQHSEKIVAFCVDNSAKAFVDAEKMQELGYILVVEVDDDGEDGEPEHDIAETTTISPLAIEECFARALSTVLTGGSDERQQLHIGEGFTALADIVKYYEEHRPRADSLGDFIDIVLKGVALPV